MSTFFRSKDERRSLLFAAFILMYSAQPCAQQDVHDVLQKIPNFFALPIEFEVDSGASNGDASILRFMPLYSFPTYNKWKLVNLDLLTFVFPSRQRQSVPLIFQAIFKLRSINSIIHFSKKTACRSKDLIKHDSIKHVTIYIGRRVH